MKLTITMATYIMRDQCDQKEKIARIMRRSILRSIVPKNQRRQPREEQGNESRN